MDGLIRKLKEAARAYDETVWKFSDDGKRRIAYCSDRAEMRDLLFDAAKALEAKVAP